MICGVTRSQKSSRATLGRGKKGRKKPQTPTIQQDESVGECQICSLSIAVPYKEENNYQRKAQPAGKACATQLYPRRVSLVTCPCTHHGSMLRSMYSCSIFLPGGHVIYMSRETTRGPRSDLPDLHMLQAASRAEGKEMTRRKQCRTSFRECTLVVSWGKKKPKPTNERVVTEIRLIWSLHWQKKCLSF